MFDLFPTKASSPEPDEGPSFGAGNDYDSVVRIIELFSNGGSLFFIKHLIPSVVFLKGPIR